MRQIELTKHYQGSNKWGTFYTTIGSVVVEGYYDLREDDLDITQVSIGSKLLPFYMIPTKVHNYLHDLISEEL